MNKSVFNFADLPCPPLSVAKDYEQFYLWHFSKPSEFYAPFISPFSQLYGLDSALQWCTVAQYQGYDPKRPLPTATGTTHPCGHLGSHGSCGKIALPQNAHHVTQGP